MKNISRRVFIKGMAVAAVATAASTVLAGCNFVPGTEGDEPSVDTTTQSFTVVDPTDSKKTLVITANKMEYNGTLVKDKQVAAIDLKLVNDTQNEVMFANTYTDKTVNNNGYQVVVSAYLNDEEGTSGTVETGTTTYADNFVTATAIPANGTNTVTKYGKVIVTAPAGYDWSKVTVKMDVYKVVTKGSSGNDDKYLVETGKVSFNV